MLNLAKKEEQAGEGVAKNCLEQQKEGATDGHDLSPPSPSLSPSLVAGQERSGGGRDQAQERRSR